MKGTVPLGTEKESILWCCTPFIVSFIVIPVLRYKLSLTESPLAIGNLSKKSCKTLIGMVAKILYVISEALLTAK